MWTVVSNTVGTVRIKKFDMFLCAPLEELESYLTVLGFKRMCFVPCLSSAEVYVGSNYKVQIFKT